jgi:4-amino-4-deoxy-L-arabinose transferase-like glycosyltransferase
VLFITPLELHPDEAQYWLWSRTLDLGYFSKPPLIAWIIAATTAIGGDSESWVRLGGPLLHAATGLLLFLVGRRLYSAPAGLLACGLYTLMPGVQLSSLVISTDAPLLTFLSAALLTYSSLPAHPDRTSPGRAALLAACLGAAALAKYAAIYALIGIALHLLTDREARRAWTVPAAAAASGAFLLVLAPNLVWNATHRFATLSHTVDNANLGGSLFHPLAMGEFLLSQFGVFGPVAFGVLVAGLIILRVRGLGPADRMLLCWIAPPLIIVTIQALLSRANANWAAAAYPAAAVLVAAWLVRWRARGWMIAALGSQAAIALVFILCVTRPDIANQIGAANSLKRSRGWDATVDALIQRARQEQGGQRLTAVAVDDRFLFNAAAYYGRDYFGRLGAPPLTMWVRQIKPNNQAESEAPLAPAQGGRVLSASYEGWFADEMAADFGAVSGQEVVRVWLDPDHHRRVELFIGERFAPLPRDPVTGLPPGANR